MIAQQLRLKHENYIIDAILKRRNIPLNLLVDG